ncbi:MAG: ribonuclease PH [Nitrospinae bacterium RIFCSPLOWO2_02_FULL_39_110]|nr:MAG: ribonuclease PH [Nitrospinae bacterium RIFCSPHIGHO2_02_39_11]OGV98422.1 MAG: ribonuclease PH [Nitrospinae bacterium RIFCSPHIGHO2_12_FULL_39_42]OGV99720.1 MAG: ribonuclease PH [Nitrospinae bacterium RIFCSPHIGHO2_02_FULL_39_82]OGW05411.1 MAG: ribonuclease PH [Nitrospinae bacterium RIFCSPLOWO2_02_39_17]OGW07352.1 MAG: ribonuclease PH [Nitrospinae bacterium RIFCSPLOWO2_02_FULL_39_110]OGW08117.1 MAG: ribonuclease PH [Nitrospinae bacterium RIFCSPLOWO2_12_FULL_39_93]OGW09735.1 MAG: ribonucle
MRADGRKTNEIRKVKIVRNFIKHAEGSSLIEVGDTRVICTATVEETVPTFLKGKGRGWVTAEYSMIPRSARSRITRESSRGKIGGRTHEIQRLIGRALRTVVDLKSLGERTVWIDCDVIQADGGTRTASITGACVALYDAFRFMKREKMIEDIPLKDFVAATSVGIVNEKIMLDLNYEEDSKADVDMNIVMTGSGKFIEIQGTAERHPFSKEDTDSLIKLAVKGIKELIKIQKTVISCK